MSGSTIGHGITVNVDARPRRAAAAVLAVRPDPQADAGFVGRDHELAQLLTLLSSDRSEATAGPRGVVAVAVAGAPGVGKTALAQAAARASVGRGWFPGGAISVNLHGYDPDPATVVWPAQLYAGLLRGLGLPGEQVPPVESDQATVYHQLLDQLAAVNRPVLLVLDNVGDADQVTELLPRGVGGHRVLITSRNTLATLTNARLLDLHVLEPAAAVELLALGLHRLCPTDVRVAADPAAAARLVELCGRLPLAVQIVVALLCDEPDRPLAELADELADEGHRLRGLDYDRRWAVRAAFDLSYLRLDPATTHLFQLLAAAPGPDVGLGVAAVLADQPEPATRAGLRGLCRAHLLDQLPAPPGQGPRWRMHDLIRLYAAERLTPDQRRAGFARVLNYYRRTADLAERRFTALPADATAVPAGFDTPEQAMAWVLAERAGLIAHTTQAVATHPEDAARLATDLAAFLDRAWLLADLVTVASAAVQATHNAPDHPLAAASWTTLGNALQRVRRFEEAITAHERAGEIYRETGDRHGEGMAATNLGNALQQVGRFEEAITALERAGEIYRETGDRHSEGVAATNLGNALQQVGRFEEAITALERAGEIYRETGDRHGEGTASTNLGLAMAEVRRFEEAIAAHERAVEIYRETGDRHGEGVAWENLGIAMAEVRWFEEAITALERAGEIYRETGDRHGEGTASTNLGNALQQVGRFEEAITALERAGEIYRETGDRHGERQARNNLGKALIRVGRFKEAITAYAQNVAISAELGDPYGQALTLENLGLVHAFLDDPQRARRTWTDAAELYTAAGAKDDVTAVRQRIADLDP